MRQSLKRLSVLVLIPILLMCVLPRPSLAASCTDADLLLSNGHIVTMDSPPIITAMAVRAGKVLALSSDAELASCASSRTNVMDLGKRTVLPGLIDVHTHVMEWTKGILRGEIDAGYPTVHSIAEIVAEVSQRVKTSSVGGWILGSGWDDSKLAEHRYVTPACFPTIPRILIFVLPSSSPRKRPKWD